MELLQECSLKWHRKIPFLHFEFIWYEADAVAKLMKTIFTFLHIFTTLEKKIKIFSVSIIFTFSP